MQKKLLLFLGLFAALATSSYSQPNLQSPTATRLMTGSQGSDPFGLFDDEEDYAPRKTIGVKAAVIVNTVQVEKIAFALLNQKRAQQGLQPLAWSEEIAAVARVHSQSMAEFKYFSHRGLDNKMVSDRADDRGMKRWRSIGENIAYNRGYTDPITKAVQLWLDSPSHRRNLMDVNWKESAVGVAVAADGSYYFTQVFLLRR